MRSLVNSALRMRRPTITGRNERTTVSTSGSSGIFRQIHYNLSTLHTNRINRNAQFVIHRAGARRRIELPGMPRATDERAFECTLPERAAMMRTDPVDRANLARHVADGVEPLIQLDFDEFARA